MCAGVYLQLLQQVSTQRGFKQLFSVLICFDDFQLDLRRAGFLQHPTGGVRWDVGRLGGRGTVHE